MENYDTEVVNQDGEEAEMIELCSSDTEAVNIKAVNFDEEETTRSHLPAPPTKKSSAQNTWRIPSLKTLLNQLPGTHKDPIKVL